jgi:hypothetical protein
MKVRELEAGYLCFSTYGAGLLASRTGATRPPENLFAELEDVCPQSRPVHRRLRFPGRGDRSVSNSLCVPRDGSRDTAHRALQSHRASTAAWTLQQLREAIPSDHSYRFLIRDRDSIFSAEVDQQLKALGLRVLRTPARAPKAKDYASHCTSWVRCAVISLRSRCVVVTALRLGLFAAGCHLDVHTDSRFCRCRRDRISVHGDSIS